MKKPQKISKQTKALSLGLEKLATSGLDSHDADQLGIEFLSGDQTLALYKSFKALCSLKFNYYDPFGKLLPDAPAAGPYYRIRYLEESQDFAALADGKKLRYVQEYNTLPVVYYPKNQTWHDIVKDPDYALIITEGELKAAKACKEGFPTIGLGGVFAWRSPKNGVTWLPSLEYIEWKRRAVYIVFDSDFRTNPNVCTAIRQLAEQMHQRGAYTFMVTLPELEGFEKIGLDDFLTYAGPTANEMFTALLKIAEPLGLTAPLWAMNDKYVYIKNPGLIINQETNYKTTPSAFKEHLELPLRYHERKIKEDGTISFAPVPAAAAWLKWPLRCEADSLTYSPGNDKFHRNNYNVWPGWGVQPVKGDHTMFLKLVDHIFKGGEKEAKEWFLAWCAYPLQYPGVKMFSSAVLHGVRHGTGKSLIGYTLAKIYGDNFTEISQADIHATHNEWAEGRQFVMGDDVTGSNKRQDADFLKKMITQKKIRINPKYIPSYTIDDCINYFFTANHPDAFFLEDDDRRFFIWEVLVGPMDQTFYMDYELWLETGGAEATFHYLKNLDLGDFNPFAPAFKTSAKERMIANVQSDLAGWVRQLLTNPDHALTIGSMKIGKDLFTSRELLDIYDPMGRTGTTANGLGRELARAGIRQVMSGRPIRVGDGSQSRYYAVRNIEYWLKMDKSQLIIKHIDDWHNKQTGRRK